MTEATAIFPILKDSGWPTQLKDAGQYLKQVGLVSEKVDVDKAIHEWIVNKDHGAGHSQMIFKGALELAKAEGLILDEASKNHVQLLCICHDLARFFDGVDLKGEPIADYDSTRTKKHAQRGAYLMLKLGEALGFSNMETRQSANNLRYHDLGYETKLSDEAWDKKANKMDQIGKIFHDADKLFAYGFSSDPLDLATQALKRNWEGDHGKDGWYFLRNDLTLEERDQFQYGDRWFSDNASTIRLELYKMRMATTAGKKLHQDRTLAAEMYAIPKVYGGKGGKYEDAELSLRLWDGGPVTLVGKNYPATEFEVEGFDGLERLMTFAQATSLKIESKFETKIVSRGVMVKIGDRLVDPTVGLYYFIDNPHQQFMTDVKEAISGGIEK